MVNRERDDNIYYARLAEQGERYEDMIKYMKEVAMVSKAITKTDWTKDLMSPVSSIENTSVHHEFNFFHFRF